MKILFGNLLPLATLSALGVSVNYPLDNLNHPFLKKKLQQSIDGSSGMPDASALTLTWSSDQTIDAIVAGYSNATLYTLKLYDSGSTLMYTKTFTNSEMGATFPAVSGVRSAKLLLDDESGNNPMTVYLGGLSIGLATAMPDPLYDWKPEYIDNSFGFNSLDGQAQGQYMEPLRKQKFSFVTPSRAVLDAVQSGVNLLGKFGTVFVIPFTGAMATVKPIYCTIPEGVESPDRDVLSYTFSLTFQEAR